MSQKNQRRLSTLSSIRSIATLSSNWRIFVGSRRFGASEPASNKQLYHATTTIRDPWHSRKTVHSDRTQISDVQHPTINTLKRLTKSPRQIRCQLRPGLSAHRSQSEIMQLHRHEFPPNVYFTLSGTYRGATSSDIGPLISTYRCTPKRHLILQNQPNSPRSYRHLSRLSGF